MPRLPADENATLFRRIEAYGPKRPGFVRQAMLDARPVIEKDIRKAVREWARAGSKGPGRS